MERGVVAERGRQQPDRLTRLREREPVEFGSAPLASTKGWMRPKSPPRTTTCGLKTLTRPASPKPSQRADLVERLEHVGRAGGGLAEDGLDLLAARRPGDGRRGAGARPRRPRSPSSRPSRSGTSPVGVDRHVPDLAREPAGAGERLAVDDQASADADLAGEEEDVLRADGGAPAQLGERAEVGLVGHGDRQRRPPSAYGRTLGQRHVAPAEVRRHRHDAGVAAHDADHADADADHAVGVGQAAQDGAREGGEVGDGLVDRAPVAGTVQAHDIEHLAADGRRRRRPASRR